MLQTKGFTLAAAVGLGALVGPSQVAARTVEIVIARYHHPIWTHVVSALLVAAGLAALWTRVPIIPLALALYGASIGLESMARGTLPLAIFGSERYPVIVGRIAMPSLIAQRRSHRGDRRAQEGGHDPGPLFGGPRHEAGKAMRRRRKTAENGRGSGQDGACRHAAAQKRIVTLRQRQR